MSAPIVGHAAPRPVPPPRPPPRLDVSLHVATCVPVNAREVRSVFSIELRTSMPAASLRDVPGASRIDVSCQGRLVVLRVRDAVTGKTLSRRIDVSRTPRRGRDRLVALAAMELLVASWVELETTGGTRLPGVDASASAQTRRSARAVASRHLSRAPRTPWRDTVVAFGAISGEDYGLASGGGVRWTRDYLRSGSDRLRGGGDRLRGGGDRGRGFSFDVLFDTARVTVPLGAVRVRTMQLSGAAHGYRTWQSVRWRGAAGARLGVITMSGIASDPATTDADTVLGLSFGPLLRAGAERSLGPVVASVSAEVGYHLLDVGGLVNRVREVSVQGPWLTLQLGVGTRW